MVCSITYKTLHPLLGLLPSSFSFDSWKRRKKQHEAAITTVGTSAIKLILIFFLFVDNFSQKTKRNYLSLASRRNFASILSQPISMAGIIRSDLTRREVVHLNDESWLASPTEGVWRRPLDRDGGEVARATTVVRFDPGTFNLGYLFTLINLIRCPVSSSCAWRW